jgi:hypothetical protein
LEFRTHTFVLRLWLEERQPAGQSPHWRGHITHVMSGQRHYFQDLAAAFAFIEAYIAAWSESGDTVAS